MKRSKHRGQKEDKGGGITLAGSLDSCQQGQKVQFNIIQADAACFFNMSNIL